MRPFQNRSGFRYLLIGIHEELANKKDVYLWIFYGMSVKLPFSTAIQTDPDMLLVDAVLSVGTSPSSSSLTPLGR